MTAQTMQQNPDGTWTETVPLTPTDDFDVEVYGTGPFVWEAWIGMRKVAAGRARTRLGLQIALLRARRKHTT